MTLTRKHLPADLYSLRRLKYVIALAIISCLCFAINVNAQIKTITIKVGNPESISLGVPSDSKISVPLEIVADDDKWHFVQFYDIPATGSVENRGTSLYPGVYSFEKLKWYYFKNRLSLSLVVLNPKTSPLAFSYRFSSSESLDPSAKPEQVEGFTRTDDAAIKQVATPAYQIELHLGQRQNLKISPSDMEFEVGEDKSIEPESAPLTLSGDPYRWTFIQVNDWSRKIRLKVKPGIKEDNITASPDAILQHGGSIGFKGTVTFLVDLDNPTPAAAPIKYSLDEWQASDPVDRRSAAVEVAQTGPGGGAKKTPIPLEVKVEKERGFFQKFMDLLIDNWLLTLAGGLVLVVVIFFLTPVAYDGLRELIYWAKQSSNKKPKEAEPAKVAKPAQGPSVLDALYESPQPTNNQKERIRKKARSQQPRLIKREAQEPALSTIGLPEKVLPQALPASDNLTNQPQGIATGTFARNRDVEILKRELDSLSSKISTVGLSEKAQAQVKALIEYHYRQTKPNDRKEILEETKINFQAPMDLYEAKLQQYRSESERRLDEYSKANQNLLLNLIDHNYKRYEGLIHNLEEKLADTIKQTQESDQFYSALLGIIVGQKVEPLQEENFNALVDAAAENLNRFFQEQVPRAEVLDELTRKTESISAALKPVLEKVAALSGQIPPEMLVLVDNFKHFADELTNMQAQLQTRQLSLVASNLRTPLSVYVGARRNLIEQLGTSIKRDIDKLRDPYSYFQSGLKKLTTTEIISVADICDSQVAKPGTNKELEEALSNLFKSADLKCILPNAREPFRPAEQNLDQIVAGSSADSQKIARIVIRGFYHKDGSKEALLRKARVEIYR